MEELKGKRDILDWFPVRRKNRLDLRLHVDVVAKRFDSMFVGVQVTSTKRLADKRIGNIEKTYGYGLVPVMHHLGTQHHFSQVIPKEERLEVLLELVNGAEGIALEV